MRLNGARIVVEALRAEKVDTVFCFPGAAIIPIYDELYLHGKGIRLVQPRHEQAGVHAADGYARVSGKTGVVLVTSGPGAANTVTGVATAAADSSPIVIITGQVGTDLVGTDAFQEVNITGILMPIAKEVIFVNDINELSESIKRAFYLAVSGRKGPVLVDITKNVFHDSSNYDYSGKAIVSSYRASYVAKAKTIDRLKQLISSSQKPLILAGAGIAESGAEHVLTKLAEMTGIPVVQTLRSPRLEFQKAQLLIGVLTAEKGNPNVTNAEYAYRQCDVLIVLGARYREPLIGEHSRCVPRVKVAQVDIDPAEIGNIALVDLPIVSDVSSVLNALLESPFFFPDFSKWVQDIHLQPDNADPCPVSPHSVVKVLSKINKTFDSPVVHVSASIYKLDGAIDLLKSGPYERIISATGNGAGEFTLPAAIGAAIAKPEKVHVVICDAIELSRSLPELITVRSEGTNIKIIVFDEAFDADMLSHAENDREHTSWVEFFTSLQLKASCVQYEDEISSQLQFIKNCTVPALLQVKSLAKNKLNREKLK